MLFVKLNIILPWSNRNDKDLFGKLNYLLNMLEYENLQVHTL